MAARDDLHYTSSRLGEVLRPLGENGGSSFSLSELVLVWATLAAFLPYFLCFLLSPLLLLSFFLSLLYFTWNLHKTGIKWLLFNKNLEACDWSSFFSRFRENQSWYKHKLQTEVPTFHMKITHFWHLSLANQTSFSKFLNQAKMLQEDQRSFTDSCTSVWFKEMENFPRV